MTLPNFIIIGAPKAGSHSLYDYLRKHPQIFMPAIKEPRFFSYRGQSDNRLKYPIFTLEEYEALYDKVRDEKAIGEASAIYFWTQDTPRRIHELLPDVKLIVSLREPVQRIFSIYHMNMRSRGANEGMGFIEALHSDPMLQRKYHECLAPYFELFPRENIKVLIFEDMVKDIPGTLRDIYGFLGVDQDFLPNLKVSNPGGVPRSKALHRFMSNPRLRSYARALFPESMIEGLKEVRNKNLVKEKMVLTPEERELGYQFFEEDIRRTQELIGVDLSRWLKPAAAAA